MHERRKEREGGSKRLKKISIASIKWSLKHVGNVIVSFIFRILIVFYSLVMNSPRQKRKVLCGNICGSRPFAKTSCATKTFQNNKEIQNPVFYPLLD